MFFRTESLLMDKVIKNKRCLKLVTSGSSGYKTISEKSHYLLYIIWPSLMIRAYFRKIKHLGIRRFLKKCPFWKKSFFSLNQKCQKQILIRGYLIFTCPSWLPRCPFVKQSYAFIDAKNPFPRIISLNSFILNT